MTIQQQSEAHTSRNKIRKRSRPKTLPRFSVILCTYNRCDLVLTALASLRRQTLAYDQFEVIVVDNGSSDDTLNVVRTYVSAGVQHERSPEESWQVQCLSEPQNGLAYARHTGLMAASGEIAVFLDDDSIAEPHFLERLLAAYEETGADAIGGRVELRWEAPRPHWLTDDLLDVLGYFAPSPTRMQLQAASQVTSFSNCNFSVKVEALRSIGYFSPFLSRRQHFPAILEIQDICERLCKAGYTLWYEPEAIVVHRVPAARLNRAYFVGRAYWQGRSEVLLQYSRNGPDEDARINTPREILQAILPELKQIIYLSLLHRPLLRLAGQPTSERIEAAMAQAREWGRLEQRLRFLDRAPIEALPLKRDEHHTQESRTPTRGIPTLDVAAGIMSRVGAGFRHVVATPVVLLVGSAEQDPAAELLARALRAQGISCTQVTSDIPLAWLWRHRAYHTQSIGIIHFYRPGALQLTHWQRRRLWFRLWLARCLGICIVTTDAGGWWQSTHSLRSLSRRLLERKLLYSSDIVLAFTRQPEQLYPDKNLRRHVRCLPHPGFHGYYTQPLERTQARRQLGLPTSACFVYLCFASAHTERELIRLIEAFDEMKTQKKVHGKPQLLLVGSPQEKKRSSARILKLAAREQAIHLYPANPTKEDMNLYMGAADAVVLPHFAMQKAGMLQTAMLALSYGLVVVAPNLPRFRGMLPPRASVLYDPARQESLVQACMKAQTLRYRMTEKELAALEAESGWGNYAYRLLKIYKRILAPRS